MLFVIPGFQQNLSHQTPCLASLVSWIGIKRFCMAGWRILYPRELHPSMFSPGEYNPSSEIRPGAGLPGPAGQTGKAHRKLVFVYR